MQLHLTSGVGPTVITKILAFVAQQVGQPRDFFTSYHFDSSAVRDFDFGPLFTFTTHDFVEKVGLTAQAARACVEGLQDETTLKKELELVVRHNISFTTMLDESYPEQLRTIHTPPTLLYVQGAPLTRFAKNLAVVGARIADDYAQAVLAAILPDIINRDWQIVSGGALGADAFAHEITLQAGGRTIVVLGTGLLSWYPRQNIDLFERVIKNGGSIISAEPLERAVEPGCFPARNRIVAGLSQGCLVVQAARKSGALITANFTLEEGRHVFAIPGSLFSPLSEGCHDLIAQGAGIVTSARVILEALDGVGSADVQQSITFQPVQPPTQFAYSGYQVPKEQEQIHHPLLACFTGAMTIDDLAIKAAKPAHQLHDELFTLQLEGFVKQNFAGLWERL
jgi:DNA processing protein